MTKPPPPTPQEILIYLPAWVGDAVMATPTLRALRAHFPGAKITGLCKAYVKPVFEATPWLDRIVTLRGRPRPRKKSSAATARRRSNLALTARLRQHGFDLAVLLPNSFRSAAMVSLANIPRRVGYDRDNRGFLLTDMLLPLKHDGRYVPVPIIDYYLALAAYLGATHADRRVELFTRPEDDAAAERLLRGAGVDITRPLVLLNPGAATKGDAKLWPAERFAAVADHLIERHGAIVLVSGSPKERPILHEVHAAARRPLIDLLARGSNLRLLKSIAKLCRLAISNDSGGRHIAAAMSVPCVSLFGPTDPEWTRLDLPHEAILHAPPPHHRMTDITLDQVIAAADHHLLTNK